MTKVALVRHGQTEYNRNNLIQGQIDIPLNEIGKKQAQLTAKNFKNVDIIISSPLSRAKETAKIIAKEINYTKDIIINESFIERDFGAADGKEIAQFINKVHEGTVENLEASTSLINRAISGLKKVVQSYQNQNIIIVTHSHTIKAILHAIEPKKYDFHTSLVNCSITILEYFNDKFTIVKTNYNDYLDK